MRAIVTAAMGILLFGAHAAAAPPVRVEGADGACPDPRLVDAALRHLVPTAVAVARDAATVIVRIEDRGASYRVGVGNRSREVRDPTRDCMERARVAAVLVIMELYPPLIGGPAPAAAPAPRPATVPASVSRPAAASGPASRPAAVTPPRWRLGIAAGALLVVAAGSDAEHGLVSGGGGLRLALMRGAFGLALGAAGLAPMTLKLAGGRAEVIRVPVDLGLVGRLRLAAFSVRGEVGAALAPLSVAGRGFATNRRVTRLEAGMRAALMLAWARDRKLAPFLMFEVVVVPRPNDLVVGTAGTLAHMPYAWGAAAVGAAFDFGGR